MSTPMVPPRPSRTNGGGVGSYAAPDSNPRVPPRPARRMDPSPSRANSSPLNELPNPLGKIAIRGQSGLSATNPIPRPPSVDLPSIGQEGIEYATYDQLPPEIKSRIEAPEQTRNVSSSMPLHAPKASVPQSTAKSRIETVTSTDSTQAAAVGIGRSRPDDDVHKMPGDSSASLPTATGKGDTLGRVPSADPFPLRQKESFNRSTPTLQHSSSKPPSVYGEEHEHGIPEIGQQIPLYPNAGDVQAPSPAPIQSQFAPGVGFFNDGSTRAHQRRRSGQPEFGPPGGYGLHGHSQQPHDQFERDWYAKNPDKATREAFNVYDSRPRPQSALSTADLIRIVSPGVGMGTNPNMIGTPGEDIAFAASDAYVSRISSAAPSPAPAERTKRPSSGSQPAVESPLRRTSYALNKAGMNSDEALEADDDGVIHVGAPEFRVSKITGGGPEDGGIDLGPHGGNTEEEGGWFLERGEGTPILASDETLKRLESASMQPAVNPEIDYDSDQHDTSRRSSMHVPSRPSSRPNSMHGDYRGGNLHRFISHDEHHYSGVHTPLEEIEEYEPLIPEGEDQSAKPKPKAPKRPGLEHHHFPSQDIWEDTPASLQFSTTVETPDLPREENAAAASAKSSLYFETPQQEQARRSQNPENMFSEKKTLMKPHLQSEMDHRPGMQRFPSKDVWEDTPDSMMYVTTVSGPQMDEARSPPEERPTTTAIPGSQDDDGARATTGFSPVMRPSVPSRPHRRSKLAEEIRPDLPEQYQGETRDISEETPPSPEKAKAPAIPDRPKPTVPARPARKDDSGAELTKTTSADGQETVTAPPAPKAKPAIPARPGGEKIAALKAGFMNDLNNRLKLGPQGPPPKAKEAERELPEEETKVPLADARKGRAKGPARRKPAASPSSAASGFEFSIMHTVYEVDEGGKLNVHGADVDDAAAPTADKETDIPAMEKALTENVITNTAEPALTEPASAEKTEEIPLPAAAAAAAAEEDTSAEEPVSVQHVAEKEAAKAEVHVPDAVEQEAAKAEAVEPASEAKDAPATKEVNGLAEKTSADQAVEEASTIAPEA